MLPALVSYYYVRHQYGNVLCNKGWFHQIWIWAWLTQETTYRNLFSKILRQSNRNWTKSPSKFVEYELIGQNCLARTFTSIVRDVTQKQITWRANMILKQMDTTKIWSIKNNTKLMNTGVMMGVLSRSERVKTKFFSVKDFHDCYSQPQHIVYVSIYINVYTSLIL